jgi:hypothetical protein
MMEQTATPVVSLNRWQSQSADISARGAAKSKHISVATVLIIWTMLPPGMQRLRLPRVDHCLTRIKSHLGILPLPLFPALKIGEALVEMGTQESFIQSAQRMGAIYYNLGIAILSAIVRPDANSV